MKKTFLSLIFAITMGVSLFVGASNSARAEQIVSENTINMIASESKLFENASSIALISGSSVILDSDTNSIIAIDVGQSKINVDGIDYTVNVRLQDGYDNLKYVNFRRGSYLNTGLSINENDFRIKFDYSGLLTANSYGYDYKSGLYQDSGGILRVGTYSRDKYIEAHLNSYKPDLTSFDLSVKDGAVSLLFDGNLFTSPLNGTCVDTSSFLFGSKMYRLSPREGTFSDKLFKLSIELSGDLVRYYIPCRRISDNTIGFMETLNGVFNPSSSSISFQYIGENFDVCYIDNGSNLIKPKNQILYLGANADYGNMTNKLILEDGLILMGTESNKSLMVGRDSLDLRVIFGNKMQNGVKYPLTITDGTLSDTIYLVKSNNVANLYITSDVDYKHLSLSKDTVGVGSLSLIDGEYSINNEQLNSIKGRGNSFAYGRKNSFNIKLANKVSIIPGVKAQKKYCLVGPGRSDRKSDLLHAQVGYTLYQQICQNGDAINFRMVNLYINGEGIGFYMLTEKVDISKQVVNINEPVMNEGSKTRKVNSTAWKVTSEEQSVLDTGIVEYCYCTDTTVEHDGGYIIEAGYYYETATSWFTTSHGTTWEVKEPESLSLSQISKLASYIQNAEDALFSDSGCNSNGEHYSSLYDLDSIAREFIVRSFCLDGDFYLTSNYLYVDGDDNGIKGKIKAGPIWDLDYVDNTTANLFCTNSVSTKYGGKFRDKLMEKGDFVYSLYNVNNKEFKDLVSNMVDQNNTSSLTVYDFYNNYSDARKADSFIWNNGSFSQSSTSKNHIITRANSWTTIWSDTTDALRGVYSSNDRGVLESHVVGTSTSYQWYKVGVDYGEVEIAGATESTYTPTESGKYYVAVNGKALKGTKASSMKSNLVVFKKGKYSSNYSSLTSALGACSNGDTLIVDQDYNDATSYTVPSGVTFDLNGHNVTNVSSFTSNGLVVDDCLPKGVLGTSNLYLDDNQEYLPIYDTDTTLSGYSFFDVSIEDKMTVVDASKSTLQFRMTKLSEECNAALDLIGKDVANCGIRAVATIYWEEDDSLQHQECQFSNNLMTQLINGSGTEPSKTYSRVFDFNIKNLLSTGIEGDIRVQCHFEAYKGSRVLSRTYGTIYTTSDLGQTWA